jgi:uncharacterized protein
MQNSPSTLFVDTSGFKAFYDEEDEHHAKARALMETVVSKQTSVRGLVTSDYILDETLTLIRFAHSHSKAVEFANAVTSSKATRLVHVDQENFAKALELFSNTSDKPWSFTDCVSFTLMRSLNLTAAFTFDPHFRQAGFQTLPE